MQLPLNLQVRARVVAAAIGAGTTDNSAIPAPGAGLRIRLWMVEHALFNGAAAGQDIRAVTQSTSLGSITYTVCRAPGESQTRTPPGGIALAENEGLVAIFVSSAGAPSVGSHYYYTLEAV